jgi:hypothetical protein
VSWSQEELVAAAYGVVFFFVLVYVAIIAAKLVRLQRETAELVEPRATKIGARRVTSGREYAADRGDEAPASPGPTAFVRSGRRGARCAARRDDGAAAAPAHPRR